MGTIIIRTMQKRYKGISKSGKSHTFLTNSNGGIWMNIPKKAVTQTKTYVIQNKETGNEMHMIQINFEDWCLRYGDMGLTIEEGLKRFKNCDFSQVIR